MIIKKIIILLILAVLLTFGARSYLGFNHFYKYTELMQEAKSIESSFDQLEAALKKAAGYSGHFLFTMELGRLSLDMALKENKFGTAERRDFYLDRARDYLARSLKKNPINALAYFEMGKVYMLYNYPLLTYMEKAKFFFGRALELKPADEFLSENILYIYLTQWERLSGEERIYVTDRIQFAKESNDNFLPRLRKKWRENFGDEDKLGEIFEKMEGIRIR